MEHGSRRRHGAESILEKTWQPAYKCPMCGRYVRKDTAEIVYSFFEIQDIRIVWRPDYNIPPTATVPVIRLNSQRRELVEMTWGLRPSWAKPDARLPLMHNARAETVATLPSYRAPFKSRRCIVPASGYFEWKAGTPKQPFYFERADGFPLALAGIWETNAATGDTVSIITTIPNAEAAKIHNRMPVILRRGYWQRWLDPNPLTDNERREMLVPAPDASLAIRPVSRAVGNVRNNSPALITPDPPHVN